MNKKKIAILAATLSLLLIAGVRADAQTTGTDPSKTIGLPKTLSTDGFRKTKRDGYDYIAAENSRYVLYVNEEGGVGIENKEEHSFYSSIPADREKDSRAKAINKMNLGSECLFTFVNEEGGKGVKNTLNGAVNKGNVGLEAIEDGVKVWYYIDSYEVTLSICYRLEEDGVRVRVPFGDLVEHIDYGRSADDKEKYDYYGLADISILPFFDAAGLSDTGYTLVPDGSGALIYHNNGKSGYGAYSQDVYGRDQALALESVGEHTETARMPVFGMKKKNDGFLAVITKGDACASINAMTSGTLTSYNQVYARFAYRQVATSTKSVSNGYGNATNLGNTLVSSVYPEEDAFEIKYFLLHKEHLDYMDMAGCYREYLKNEKGFEKKPSAEDTATGITLFGGLKIKKYIFGFPFQITRSFTSYDDAARLISDLNEKQVGNLVIKYRGWQKGGLESAIPVTGKYERALGGSRGWQKLRQQAAQTGTKLYPDVDLANFYRSGNGLSTYRDSVQLLSLDTAFQYEYDLNTGIRDPDTRWRLLTPGKVTESGKKLAELSLSDAGISVGSLGSAVYSNYSSGAGRKNREDAKNEFASLLSDMRSQCGSVMVDQGNMYAAVSADYIDQSAMQSSHFDIADESVPFYQAVLHGYTAYFTEPVNLTPDPDLTVLQALETGSSLSYTLMKESPYQLVKTRYNGMYNAVAEDWIDTIAEQHRQVDGVMRLVSGAEMVSHRMIGKGVTETGYANGIRVRVDYNKKAFAVAEAGEEPEEYRFLTDEIGQEER